MGIVYDPKLYRATGKHFAHRPLPDYYADKWETWHVDACYDNGYFSTVMFATAGPFITVAFHVTDPSGKSVVDSMQLIKPEDFTISTETLDIKMGENFFRGDYTNSKFPRNEISVHDGNNGAELVYEALVQPTISELPDGVGIGRLNTPNMPVIVGWIFQPYNKITGNLIIDGKKVPVTGRGWLDHQFGNVDFFRDSVQYFYWGCLPLGKHTLCYFDIQLAESGGYRPLKWLWDWKDGELYEYCRDCDFYIQADEIEEGDTVPRRLFIVFEHERIRGTITCGFKALMQKQVLDYAERKITLNRSAYDCHAELNIDGEDVDTRFTRILEIAYGVEKIVESADLAAKEEENEVEIKAARLSQESLLGEVIEDPAGLEILEKHVPGISTDPGTKMGYGMPLKVIFGMPQAGVSKEKLAAIDRELREIE